MGLDLPFDDGQTPLEEDEKEGLLIKTITTRGELDEFEQYNIEKAVEWSIKNKFPVDQILQEKFILNVHKRMYSEVWRWAGQFRRTNKNIGVDKFHISVEVKKLLDACHYWIKNRTFIEDEIAIRFKHRLVSIHPFSNGNGRHSRLCADILVSHGLKQPVFTWYTKVLSRKDEAREKYLEAIRHADQGNYKPLIEFARS